MSAIPCRYSLLTLERANRDSEPASEPAFKVYAVWWSLGSLFVSTSLVALTSYFLLLTFAVEDQVEQVLTKTCLDWRFERTTKKDKRPIFNVIQVHKQTTDSASTCRLYNNVFMWYPSESVSSSYLSLTHTNRHIRHLNDLAL